MAMARKLILSSILVALFSLFTIGETTNYAHADAVLERLMRNLRHVELYNIPENQDAEAWLKKLIRTLRTELKREPANPEKVYLFLGDAYHWLGHYLEATNRLDEAFVAYKMAKEQYKKSNALYSPGINFYWPEGHANFHLVMLADKLWYPVEAAWRHGHHQQYETDQKSELLREYMDELREIVTSVERSMLLVQPGEEHHECEKLFINIPE